MTACPGAPAQGAPGHRTRLPSSPPTTFYEGAMVAGYPSDATEDAVQANVVAAGYR
ncbi:arabinofuranosidase catalytic domain-containing protein [Micromonospora sp. NPDC048930]|uniref:arabinofuranosidase catalytic domain-containing protein n=1 Tax=Micromonospora sp. NPDC048930 TaxID=3364261 RepID=UPI003714D9F0